MTVKSRYSLLSVATLLFTCSASAAMEDDPLLYLFQADQLELRDADEGTVTGWEAHFWVGKDLDKLWIKTEGERTDEGTEGAEVQLLYSRAIDPNWDLQLGLRHDAKPEPSRDWLAIGFHGVAPYFIEMDMALFIEQDEVVNLRLEAEYEFMLTQKWVLSPEAEINWISEDDESGLGSGFADFEAGIRLRYEVSREFAPYVGLHYERLLGDAEDNAEAEGEDSSSTQWVAGLRFWF